jgi:hypothetical protein
VGGGSTGCQAFTAQHRIATTEASATSMIEVQLHAHRVIEAKLCRQAMVASTRGAIRSNGALQKMSQ